MTATKTTTQSYEPVRRDFFRPLRLDASDTSLALTALLSPVDEQMEEEDVPHFIAGM